MIRVYMLSFLILVSCTKKQDSQNEVKMEERWKHYLSNVEIIRDNFGVPHIYGKSDADAVFGLMYAQCEDDFNRVEQNYIWAIGRLAEVKGKYALYSDLRANLYMTKQEALQNFENSPRWLQELCIAFADGVNYYLKKHPEVEPKLITHFEPWMPMYFSEGSIGGDIERISTKKIGQFYDNSNIDQAANIHTGFITPKDNEPRGSNGFAISGERTLSGKAMLLINPHTSFFFRGEVHVVSEEGLNAYGAVTWGQFFVYQGFNEKTGWMHTSTGTDVIDEFEETIISSKEGKSYQYGDQIRGLDSIEVVLKYSTKKGIKEKSFMTYRTHHGPITHSNGNKWVTTSIMWNPRKALEQSYMRTKNSTHKDFYKMMDIRTNSSNNTVYADADGNIAYYHGNFIPVRDTLFDYRNPVDGSNPRTDWQGIHDLNDNIFILNPKTGWIQNCNSTPFTCAGPYSPKRAEYPRYMTSFPENFRGIHAIPLLKNSHDLTIDKLIDLAYDPYLPGADQLISSLVEAYDDNPDIYVDIKKEMNLLRSWNFEVSLTSNELTMAQYYRNTYYKKANLPKKMRYMERMNYISNETSFQERINIFRMSLKELEQDFGTHFVAWGDINRYQRINGDINQIFNDSLSSIPVGMASGSWGALASFGSRRGTNTLRQYGVAGNSFVAVVEFGDKVKAKSMLAGGQSGDPNSPHFDDQAQNYADRVFKTVSYYRDDVIKNAELKYVPGEEKITR